MDKLLKAIELVNNNSINKQTVQYNELLLENYIFVYEKVLQITNSGDDILDIGTAYGVMPLALKLSDRKVEALDIVKKYTNIKLLEDNDINFIVGDIETGNFNFKNKKLIIFTEVLEHLCSNPLETIKKIKNYLSIDGYILITTPKWEVHGFAPGLYGSLYSWKDIPLVSDIKNDEHNYHYSQIDLISLMDKAGLEIVELNECYSGLSHYLLCKQKNTV